MKLKALMTTLSLSATVATVQILGLSHPKSQPAQAQSIPRCINVTPQFNKVCWSKYPFYARQRDVGGRRDHEFIVERVQPGYSIIDYEIVKTSGHGAISWPTGNIVSSDGNISILTVTNREIQKLTELRGRLRQEAEVCKGPICGKVEQQLDYVNREIDNLSRHKRVAVEAGGNEKILFTFTTRVSCSTFGICGEGAKVEGYVKVYQRYLGNAASLRDQSEQVQRNAQLALANFAQSNSGSIGFYRQSNRLEVYLVYRSGFYCHVQNEDQMQAYGGFEKVNVVDNLNLTGTETGECGWPNGFYRRSNQPEVYRMFGNENQAFNIGSAFCHVVDDAQMSRFGGSQQVQVVSPSSDLGRGRNFAGECSNP